MNWKESYSDQIENLISYSKLIYQRGLVSAAGGNISARFCMLTLCFPQFGPCKIRSFLSTQNPPN